MCTIKKFKTEADKKDIRDHAERFITCFSERFTVQEFYNLLIENWNVPGKKAPSYASIAIKLDPHNPAPVTNVELKIWARVLKPVFDKYELDWKESFFIPHRTFKYPTGRIGKFIPSEDTKDLTTDEVTRRLDAAMRKYQAMIIETGMDQADFDADVLNEDEADDMAEHLYMILGWCQLSLSHCPGNLLAAQAKKSTKIGSVQMLGNEEGWK